MAHRAQGLRPAGAWRRGVLSLRNYKLVAFVAQRAAVVEELRAAGAGVEASRLPSEHHKLPALVVTHLNVFIDQMLH